METAFHAVALASSGAVSGLISAVWEGCVLAALAALCLRLLPRLSAAARSVVWLNVFLLLVVLHVAPALAGHEGAMTVARAPRIDLDARWSFAVAGLWAALSAWRAAQLAASAVRLKGIARRAVPIGVDADLAALLAGGPRGRPAQLCASSEVERPSVVGFFRPRILIPPDLAGRLTTLEMRQVVLHEMEHLRRADDWTNLLQKVALVLFPLNPVLAWVEGRLCAERELACDDRVLLSSGARKAYAICLTRLAEYSMLRRSLTLALGAWERRPELVRRVHRILWRKHAAMGLMQSRVVTAALMLGVAGGAVALARSPQIVEFSPAATLEPGLTVGSALGAGSAAAGEYGAMNVRTSVPARPQLVEAKAVMPEPVPVTKTQRAAETHAARPVRARATMRKPSPKYDVGQENWVVMTEWTQVNLPPHAVVTVKLDRQGVYAAVPIAGGWLIVQI
jgi:beta-lactamase regulating signal transducer with metallopeptidase domain